MTTAGRLRPDRIAADARLPDAPHMVVKRDHGCIAAMNYQLPPVLPHFVWFVTGARSKAAAEPSDRLCEQLGGGEKRCISHPDQPPQA
jgi:hypothetical protein